MQFTFAHNNYNVRDLDRSLAFYKKRCIVKKNRVLEVPRSLAVIKTDDWGLF